MSIREIRLYLEVQLQLRLEEDMITLILLLANMHSDYHTLIITEPLMIRIKEFLT